MRDLDEIRASRLGLARTGTVGIRDFDQGVVETLGATVIDAHYYIKVDGITGPPGESGYPGVPVVFSTPEDVMTEYRLPYILVRRDDIAPANERWQSVGAQQYGHVPGAGAMARTVRGPGGTIVRGFDRNESLVQAKPFDIMYTIEITARHRGAIGQRNQVNLLLHAALRAYPPYGQLLLTDSLGDRRSYECFMEGVTSKDSIAEVTDRKLGFQITLRVIGELDIDDPITTPTAIVPLTRRTRQI